MPEKRIHFHDDEPMLDLPRGDGRHLITEGFDGARLEVEVRNGAVVAVSAERDGEPVEAFYILATETEEAHGHTGPKRRRKKTDTTYWFCTCQGLVCHCKKTVGPVD